MTLIRTMIFVLAAAALAAPAAAAPIRTAADSSGPAQIEIAPPSGKGRIVIVIAGKSGPGYYEDYAERIAKLGYDTFILKGGDILNRDKQGGTRLRQAIARAEASPHAVHGKIAVIGFSQGGGGALAYATRGAHGIAIVVAYYPETAFVRRPGFDLKHFVSGFVVPVLAFAGGKDTFEDCCLLSTIKAIDAAAKDLGKPFELVIYPNAGHDFIKGASYRAADAADAWKRTTDALAQHLADQDAK